VKIALLHPSLKPPRGAERQVCNLAFHLQKMKHDVTLYVFDEEVNPVFNDLLKSIDVKVIDVGNKGRDMLFTLKKFGKEFDKYDIINPHNFFTHWVVNYVKKPVVWSCNEPLIWDHFSWTEEQKYEYYEIAELDELITKKIRVIASLDNDMKRILEETYPNNEVVVTHSGVEIRKNIRRKQHDGFNILLVGALHPQKHPTDILFALNYLHKKIPKINVHYVGGDYMNGEVLRIAHKLNIKTIHHDTIDDDKMYELFRITDIAMLIGERQPWGIFPLETLMMGIPTIVSDEVGMRNIIPPKCISVSKMGDIRDLAINILDVYLRYDEYRNNIKKYNVRKMLSEKYSWGEYTKRMIAIYEGVLNGNEKVQ
jgi:glycosyltransferase involved in cell wall biosynthesis